MPHNKTFRNLVLLQAILLITIGLWDLFSRGLPPIDKTALFVIFPRIFPIVFGSIFLFVLPLLNEKRSISIWIILLFTFLMAMAALQLNIVSTTKYSSLTMLMLLNLAAFVAYLYLLNKFRKNKQI